MARGIRLRKLVGGVVRCQTVSMTLEKPREIHQARPFRPFILYFADGGKVGATHPESLAYSRTGRTAVVVLPDESSQWFDLLLVSRIEISDGQSK